jgi:ribosomal protein S18 acetylase RimI-like enzyme
VQFRTALSTDLDALRDVYRRSSLANDSDREVLLAHPDALEFTGDGIDEERTLVAVQAGQILGFATAGRIVDGAIELDDLFVDPECQRQGIGRALVTELAARARRVDVTRVEVTANPDALAFYEAVGFRTTGSAETRFGPAPRMTLDL